MSGLDPQRHVILEMASIVTDDELRVIAEGPELVIHHPDAVLDAMDAWCTEHHGASGLSERVRTSRLSHEEAELRMLTFLRQCCGADARPPLCGNSIHQDRRFLQRHMPELERFFHYRNVDVSTIKELVRRWYPDVELPQKRQRHRALDDVRESIAELAYYRQRVFTR